MFLFIVFGPTPALRHCCYAIEHITDEITQLPNTHTNTCCNTTVSVNWFAILGHMWNQIGIDITFWIVFLSKEPPRLGFSENVQEKTYLWCQTQQAFLSSRLLGLHFESRGFAAGALYFALSPLFQRKTREMLHRPLADEWDEWLGFWATGDLGTWNELNIWIDSIDLFTICGCLLRFTSGASLAKVGDF